MEPSDISLETMNKLFEYEKHSRLIDEMDIEELRNFAKLYCKLYLKQQEVISTMKIESRI
jgi:hypothetical protein